MGTCAYGILHFFPLNAYYVTQKQNSPVYWLRDQFLPLNYKVFCCLSNYFMFPKWIYSFPNSSLLQKTQERKQSSHIVYF